MTKQEIEKCYDPFFTTKPTGVGLGMTISLKLVKENGGDIELESLYGKGTTIQIILPRSIEKEGES
jgi:signal transduction histidine kinase